MIAGLVVAPLGGVCEEQNEMKIAGKVSESLSGNLTPKADFSIKHLKDLTENQYSSSLDTPAGSSKAETSPMDRMDRLEALEGADPRHLSSFLMVKDETRVLRKLYREFREQVTAFGRQYIEYEGLAQIV
ncbi:hypothetical protein BGX24_007825 [Mortierella sp. AD032]|nr:hypothetical protein BGX24_007825 [Mortierella sp. AD032]